MTRTNRRSISVLAALTFAVPATGLAQVQPVYLGNGMDANPGMGTGGSNVAVPGYVPVNQNNIIYGNVPGLGYFHGQINTFAPNQFNANLPSSSLNYFARASAPIGPGFNGAYYLPSSLVSTASGNLYSAPVGSGFDAGIIPRSAVSPLATPQQLSSLDPNGNSINALAINRANAAVVSLEPGAPGAILSSPVFALRVPAIKQQGEGMLDAYGNLVDSNAATTQPGNDLTLPLKVTRSMTVGQALTGQVDPRIDGQPDSVKNASLSPKIQPEVDDRLGDTFHTLMDDLHKAEAAAAKETGKEPSTTAPADNSLKGSNLITDTLDPLTGMPRKMSPFLKPSTTQPGGLIESPSSQNPLTPKRLEDMPLTTLRIGSTVKPVKTFVPVRADGRQTPVDVLMARGEKALKAGKYLEAAEAYQAALGTDPNNALALVGRAHAELGAGMYQSAAYDLKFVFTRNPQMVSVRYDMDTFIPKARQEALINDLGVLAGSKESSNAASFLLCYLYYETGRTQLLGNELQKWSGREGHDAWQVVLNKAWADNSGGGH